MKNILTLLAVMAIAFVTFAVLGHLANATDCQQMDPPQCGEVN